MPGPRLPRQSARIRPIPPAQRRAVLALRLTRRDLRLGSGLALFFYVATHLANHALGLISVAAAQRGLDFAVATWHSLPGTLLLYGAAGTHVTLAFVAIYQRRTLRMPPLELVRIVLGLGIPILLIGHAIGTRIAWELHEVSPAYSRVVWDLWTSDSEGRQLALLAPGWLHGCLGIHFAFSHRRLYRRLHYGLFVLAVLLPVLAALGFLAMTKELALATADHAMLDAARAETGARVALARLRDTALAIYFSAIAGVFALRELRALIEQRRKVLVQIAYPGRTVHVPRGWTVLEASRSFHIPHASMCGGRARCSTCRVQVTAGAERCAAPGPDEQATLERIRAPAGVRLACQLRPTENIAVVPLLAAAGSGSRESREAPVECDIALLLVDWRDREAFARAHLPQDVVYVTQLFCAVVDSAVRATRGAASEYTGADAAAVFGIAREPADACRDALAAADALAGALAELSGRLAAEFRAGADFALCLHVGHAAVASTGPSEASRLLVAGEAVAVANRLRAVAAELRAAVVVSAEFLQRAVARAPPEGREIPVPGTSIKAVALASLDGVAAIRRTAAGAA